MIHRSLTIFLLLGGFCCGCMQDGRAVGKDREVLPAQKCAVFVGDGQPGEVAGIYIGGASENYFDRVLTVPRGKDLTLRFVVGNGYADQIFLKRDGIVAVDGIRQDEPEQMSDLLRRSFTGNELLTSAHYTLLRGVLHGVHSAGFIDDGCIDAAVVVPLAKHLGAQAKEATIELEFSVVFYKRSTGQEFLGSAKRALKIRLE